MLSKFALLISGILLMIINIIYPIIWFSLLMLGKLLWRIVGKEFPRTFTDKFATFWGLLQIAILFTANGARIKLTGLESLEDYDGPLIMNMNHQSTFDIAAAYYILWKTGRNLRWVLKKELLRAPVIGVACKESKSAFVDRKDREKAKEELLRFSKQLQKDNVSAAIFIEGTRATPRKMKKSNYPYLLNPKPMGLSILKEQLPDWPLLHVTLDWTGKTGTTIFNTSILGVTLRIHCDMMKPEDVPEDFTHWLFEEEWPRRNALIGEWRKEAGLLHTNIPEKPSTPDPSIG